MEMNQKIKARRHKQFILCHFPTPIYLHGHNFFINKLINEAGVQTSQNLLHFLSFESYFRYPLNNNLRSCMVRDCQNIWNIINIKFILIPRYLLWFWLNMYVLHILLVL